MPESTTYFVSSFYEFTQLGVSFGQEVLTPIDFLSDSSKTGRLIYSEFQVCVQPVRNKYGLIRTTGTLMKHRFQHRFSPMTRPPGYAPLFPDASRSIQLT